MSCKYTFCLLVLVLLLLFNACTGHKFYYTPEYVQYQKMQEKLKATRREEAKKRKIDKKNAIVEIKREQKIAKQSRKDSIAQIRLNLKKERLAKRKARKKALEKKKREKKSIISPPADTSSIQTKKDTISKKKIESEIAEKKSPTSSVDPSSEQSDSAYEKKFNISKDAIKELITQKATKLALMDGKGNIRLVGNTTNDYKDMKLAADTILYNLAKKQMIAIPLKDSLSRLLNKISFTQGNKLFKMDAMTYNPVTKQAIFENVQTKEGDLFIHSKRVRQDNDSIFFGKQAIFSTCNYYPPHFSFRSDKFKLVRNKTIVTGSLYAYFEGVPLPPEVFILPFAVLPMPKQRTSGIIIPEIITDGTRGFGLSNGGYYWVPSPYIDFRITGSYFALGQYNITLASTYLKRYLFRGNFKFDYQYNRNGNTSDADFFEDTQYKINWSFNLDPKVNPSIAFAINLNLISSARYNVNAIQSSAVERLNNTSSSSISFTKKFKRGPVENITLLMSHAHNTTTKIIDLGFPNIKLQSVQFNPVYLFSKKRSTGAKWYDKLRFRYTLDFKNTIKLTEDASSIPAVTTRDKFGRIRVLNDASPLSNLISESEFGATQQFPLTLALPKVGPTTLSPNITYSQNLVDRRAVLSWNAEQSKVDTLIERGIYARHQLSTGMNFNFDDLIATLQFGKKSQLQAIRHIVRFSTGFTYRPDIASETEYQSVQTSIDNEVTRLNYYTLSRYTKQESGNINISLGNVIQAKWIKKKAKGDTSSQSKPEIKKADIVTFNFSTSYDLIADSFNLKNISLNYTTNISQKLSFSGGATFDPYVYDKGRRTPKLVWEEGQFGLGSLTAFTLGFNFSLGGKSQRKELTQSKPKEHPEQKLREDYQGEQYDIINETRDVIVSNPDYFVDFSIPWSLKMGVNVRYSRGSYDITANNFKSTITTGGTISGDISLTKKWKLGYSGLLDLQTLEIVSGSINLSRDLHCWQLTINITPIGAYKSFGLIIQPKSNILRDLKLQQTRNLY